METDKIHAKKVAALIMKLPSERIEILVERMAQLIASEWGHDSEQIMEWIEDDNHHCWNER